MKFKKITLEEFKSLNPLVKENDLINVLRFNVESYFFKPLTQDFPIYKVTLIDPELNLDTFQIEEYFIQRLESPLTRWDKSWETCGIPKEIIELL